ncbi:MAG: NTP transferase domain-containing protein [Nitrospirae bacterium]|nr:NTP transferase domain-containing protein [Candidatus Troglogloeales bacterium]MBI3598821.1 NTP transferase domain-containing protein [Candidatus Troglogloeales bacterium]
MGKPKEGALMPDGRKMIEHVIKPLVELCQKIVIVGNCRGFFIPPQQKFIALPDDPPGRGPLSAIATLLKSGIDKDGYVVTACDQPFLTPDLLLLLLEGKPSVPRIFKQDMDEMMTPLPGYYPVCWLSKIKGELESGEYSLCNAILKSAFETVLLPRESRGLIRNINTLTDLETFASGQNR